MSHRLPQGGQVDRSATVSFSFDGRRYAGHPGDTLASALLANGVTLVGRSFKYHRPRGFLSAGPEEPNGLVELRSGARREPNTKATTVELFEGLEAQSQNRWPSLGLDVLAVNQLAAPVFTAGFYYKTFMWPAALWEKLYEPAIRRAAGLGRASGDPDPDHYESANAFCDVLVVGAGPAGLAAALAAGRTGARVILCEDDFRLGGRLLSDTQEIDGMPAAQWAAAAEAELATMPEIRILRRTHVVGLYDGNTYAALERVSDHLPNPAARQPRQRLWHIVARRCILATGAVERPIVFGGNDRPGVMLAAAMRTYLNRFAIAAGKRVAIFTTSDDGWATAADLAARGISVEAVIDARPDVAPSARARAGSARILLDASVRDVAGNAHGVTYAHIVQGGREIGIDIDALAVSGGWNPQLGLATHKGHKPRWSEQHATFVPGDLPDGVAIVGAANGDFALGACLRSGSAEGIAAARDTGFAVTQPPISTADDESVAVRALWHVPEARYKAFVDLQNDVTLEDVELAHREGFRSVEHLKRYTTLGMATDQGRTSNIIGHALMAELTGRSIPETGTTRSRPPHFPVAIGAFAGPHRGKHFRPTRYTSAHDWALAHNAKMVEAGQWLRPQWFTAPGESDWLESVTREVRTVRAAAGICDVSTLGKIDIQGPDAGALLDRVYINTFSTLPRGKARYGAMLREDGFVMDDGTSARLSETHFVMSTTTANAAKVMQHLNFCHQVLWPELRVGMVSVTEQWSQYAIAGPRSRELLQTVVGDSFDLSSDSFPYLACAEFRLGGVPMRIFRLSFSGELAYEIACPARYGESLASALHAAGEPFGATLYGTEALGVLRIEKGHVAGNELNGQTTARDLGLGKMMSTKKDYIGRVLANRPALVDPSRFALAGFKPVEAGARLRAGAHFLPRGAATVAANDIGYMTSVAYSPHVGSWIGLGLIAGGIERIGQRVRAYDPVRNGDVEVEVVAPGFVDPEGGRLHA